GVIGAAAVEPLGDEPVDGAVRLEGDDGVVDPGGQVGVFLAQADGHAFANHDLRAGIFDRSARGADDGVDIGAVGEDGVEIAGGEVGHGLVGGGEGNHGVVLGEIAFGIIGLDGAALHADTGARKGLEVDGGAGEGNVARRIGREIFVAAVDRLLA